MHVISVPRIHVWYICHYYLPIHLVDFYGFHVGTYTSPMDPMGYRMNIIKFSTGLDSGAFPNNSKHFANMLIEFCMQFHSKWIHKHASKRVWNL